MESKREQSVKTFKNGYNCAQSVLSVFAKDLGINKDTSLKLASPFGSGIARMQETCGAVIGALMVIGLKYGKGETGTEEDKIKAYDLSNQFMTEFKKNYGTVCCRELLEGVNMNTPEGMAKIKELDWFQVRCAKYVQDAVSITEKIVDKV